jgi:[ribosomal protein S5]-alanine N-acetyltransferase
MLNRLPSAENPFIENYAIILKNKSEGGTEAKKLDMIGVIGIPRLSHAGTAAEVGYGILPGFWGKGYASEALVLFVKHYFSSDSKSAPYHNSNISVWLDFLPLSYGWS